MSAKAALFLFALFQRKKNEERERKRLEEEERKFKKRKEDEEKRQKANEVERWGVDRQSSQFNYWSIKNGSGGGGSTFSPYPKI